MLGQEWKEASMEIRNPHVEREKREREEYLERISEWRKMRNHEEELIRQKRVAVAEHCVQSNIMLPTEAMLAPTEIIPETSHRESLTVTPSLGQRLHFPAPLFESCSFSQTYINPNIPSVALPLNNGLTAGYFHVSTTASVGREMEEPVPPTTSSGNSLVPLLPKPQQLPQAPFEAANPLREQQYQVDGIPILPFGKYIRAPSKLKDDDCSPKDCTLFAEILYTNDR